MSVLRGHSVFSSPLQRPITSDFEGFLYQILSIILFSYLNSWERASIFPFECSVLNKDTTGTIFITFLVSRGPWLGIEHGTSRTGSQHYTTRLSRRRWNHHTLRILWFVNIPKPVLYTKLVNSICPALEASTIPLGYRGGGEIITHLRILWFVNIPKPVLYTKLVKSICRQLYFEWRHRKLVNWVTQT